MAQSCSTAVGTPLPFLCGQYSRMVLGQIDACRNRALFSLSVCSNQSRARSRFVSASADVLCAIRVEAQAMGEAYFCCSCLYVWHAVLSITCAGMLCFKPTGLACCASNLQGWHAVLQTYRAGMLCIECSCLACCADIGQSCQDPTPWQA